MNRGAALRPTTSVGLVEGDPAAAAVTRKTMAFREKDRHTDSSTYFLLTEPTRDTVAERRTDIPIRSPVVG